tara:strand:+ start:199 stop:735 length:537 start_codon:yes stop_codon:yes gene_type:complete
MSLAEVWMHLVKDKVPVQHPVDIPRAFLEGGDKDALESANVPNIIIQEWELESLGGNCVKCHKPWRRVEVDNLYVTAEYYRPDCHCFPRCPLCAHYLWTDLALQREACSNCDTQLSCPERREKTIPGSKGYNYKKVMACGAKLLLSRSGYVCPDCNYSVSYTVIRDRRVLGMSKMRRE